MIAAWCAHINYFLSTLNPHHRVWLFAVKRNYKVDTVGWRMQQNLIEIGILYSRQPLQPNIIKFITNAKLVPINCRFVTVTCIPNDREKSTFKYYLADLEEWRRKMHKHTHFFSRFVDIICRSLSLVLLIWQDIWLLLSTIKFPFFRRLILHQVQRFHCWTFPF